MMIIDYEELFCSFDCVLLEKSLRRISADLVAKLTANSLRVSFAESCTGGLLAKLITDVSGSSNVLECSIVSYSNRIKEELLGVSKKTIDEHTEVSFETAIEMAKGARKLSGASLSVSTTGVSGPAGAAGSCVGISFIALFDGKESQCKRLDLSDKKLNREQNRLCTAKFALSLLSEYLDERLKLQ